jgi:CheY-like chemotaxis protein
MSKNPDRIARFGELTEAKRASAFDVDVRRNAVSGQALIVDDCNQGRRLQSQLLAYFGLHVSSADGGAAAIIKAAAAERGGSPFDLILMDIMMPEMDGWAATEALRAGGFKGGIIAVTGNVEDGARERCIRCGCNAYVDKPIEIDALLAAIRRCLRPSLAQPRRIPISQGGHDRQAALIRVGATHSRQPGYART